MVLVGGGGRDFKKIEPHFPATEKLRHYTDVAAQLQDDSVKASRVRD